MLQLHMRIINPLPENLMPISTIGNCVLADVVGHFAPSQIDTLTLFRSTFVSFYTLDPSRGFPSCFDRPFFGVSKPYLIFGNAHDYKFYPGTSYCYDSFYQNCTFTDFSSCLSLCYFFTDPWEIHMARL